MTIETYGGDALDNTLVAQKEEILDDINEGRYDLARIKLDFVACLWLACGYDYKGQELRRRIVLAKQAAENPDFLQV